MTEQEARKKILQLSKEIKHHNHLYYNESKQEISDFEFDKLLESLLALERRFLSCYFRIVRVKEWAEGLPKNLSRLNINTRCFR
jgi:NAD-dependent DNA ligase